MNPENSFSLLRLAPLCAALLGSVCGQRSVATDLQNIGPLDATLTQPQNPVAKNLGVWDGSAGEPEDGLSGSKAGTTENATLHFRKNGFSGMWFEDCGV